jgi:hypothetical protein
MYELERLERRKLAVNMEWMQCGGDMLEAAFYLSHPESELSVFRKAAVYRYHACLARRYVGYMGRVR